MLRSFERDGAGGAKEQIYLRGRISERRAKRVFDILVSAGISEDRLTHQGGGVDESVESNASEARNIVRRVTFTLN